jgi:hypothetical protein
MRVRDTMRLMVDDPYSTRTLGTHRPYTPALPER